MPGTSIDEERLLRLAVAALDTGVLSDALASWFGQLVVRLAEGHRLGTNARCAIEKVARELGLDPPAAAA